jgi:peptidoglycan/LPS O-acetylase OafA/YrhL
MPNNPTSGREFAGLEIARFLCALAVMFWHYQHFFYKGIYESIASGADTAPAAAVTFPLHWLFGFFYDNGNYAVQVFWMISGLYFSGSMVPRSMKERFRRINFSFFDFPGFILYILQL